MPNWIEGSLKLRGNSEDLKRFFKEGVDCPAEAVYIFGDLKPEIKPISAYIECDFDKGYNFVTIKNEPHIRNTRRAFIQDCYVEWEEKYSTVHMPIKQAWAFIACDEDRQRWEEISAQYRLDIRLYGFERGMEFCEEVEIVDGKVVKDSEIKYADWAWECPMPGLGG